MAGAERKNDNKKSVFLKRLLNQVKTAVRPASPRFGKRLHTRIPSVQTAINANWEGQFKCFLFAAHCHEHLPNKMTLTEVYALAIILIFCSLSGPNFSYRCVPLLWGKNKCKNSKSEAVSGLKSSGVWDQSERSGCLCSEISEQDSARAGQRLVLWPVSQTIQMLWPMKLNKWATTKKNQGCTIW